MTDKPTRSTLPFAIMQNHPFSNDSLINHMDALFMRSRAKDNHWLNVTQVGYGEKYADKGRSEIPAGTLADLRLWMIGNIWDITGHKPNTAYVQCGGPVKPHRDPVSDKYFTSIAYFGDFTGGELIVQHGRVDHVIAVKPGMVVVLPCTLRGLQGPLHWTRPHKGHRCSFILNHTEA